MINQVNHKPLKRSKTRKIKISNEIFTKSLKGFFSWYYIFVMVMKVDYRTSVSLDTFKEVILNNEYDENMFDSNGDLNPDYNSFKRTGVIANIFEDHWDDFYLKNKEMIDKYRPNANEEILKMINCHNKSLGCSVFECPECHDMIFVGHTCKSRLCSSCGYKIKNQRVENILETCYKCKHRQIVFTIPKELRKYFFFPFESRIDLLFKAVRDTLYSIINEKFKYSKKKKKMLKYVSKIKSTPGFFAFLHTFGRDLIWNPHIHVLIAELKLSDDGKIEKMDYFNFKSLRTRFQKTLLDLLKKEIGPDFKIEKTNSYKNHKNGFYVYAEKKEFKSLKEGIEYVTRYCGRCPISENRIVNYDGQNVTFSYNSHYDESYHEVAVSAEEFITMLLRHIIPKNYKIIRYYGFYRKKHKLHDKIVMLIDKIKIPFRRSLLKYDISILKSFKRNPYNCPKCNIRMDFVCLIT